MEILQVVLVFIVLVNFSESCKPYYECKILHECPRMIQLLKNRNDGDIEFVEKSNCGYVDEIPMVCCPKIPCWTLDRREGDCMSIHDCPAIKSLNQSHGSTTSNITFSTLLKSQLRCLNIEDGVCCPFPSRPTQPEPKTRDQNEGCLATHLPPKPDSNCCGVDPEVGHRISRGAPTLLHQYTWLAILEYNDSQQALCAGSLISGSYVLTAAHCVYQAKPVSVLLGEYDRSNNGRDCKNNQVETCMESQQIYINEIIPHPKFSWINGPPFPNDIALLQLSNMANFNNEEKTISKRSTSASQEETTAEMKRCKKLTKFIRPICLPSVAVHFGQGLKLISAGWGATETQDYSSNIKMAVEMPFLKTNDCSEQIRTKLEAGHMCTGNRYGEGPCLGDSGGPLMHQTGGRFEAVGVHSFGSSKCGVRGRPHIFTNVTHYLDWIHDNIQILNSS